jgi:hypothetical protein
VVARRRRARAFLYVTIYESSYHTIVPEERLSIVLWKLEHLSSCFFELL